MNRLLKNGALFSGEVECGQNRYFMPVNADDHAQMVALTPVRSANPFRVDVLPTDGQTTVKTDGGVEMKKMLLTCGFVEPIRESNPRIQLGTLPWCDEAYSSSSEAMVARQWQQRSFDSVPSLPVLCEDAWKSGHKVVGVGDVNGEWAWETICGVVLSVLRRRP